MEERNVKIRFEYTNVFGEKFVTEREVPEDFCEMDELDVLNDTYKNFLENCTFAMNLNDEVILLREDQYVETRCDCNCDECEDWEDEEFYDADDFVGVVADKVIDKLNNARRNTNISF